jgi:hypothetical protein
MTTHAVRCLATGLLLALLGTVSASDYSVDDPILGQWVGVVSSDASVDLPLGYMALDIDSRQNRAYQGLIALVPPNPIYPTDPTYPVDPTRMMLSANGNVSLTSQSDDWTLDAQGVLVGNDLFLEYHINYRDGAQDFGVIMLSR